MDRQRITGKLRLSLRSAAIVQLEHRDSPVRDQIFPSSVLGVLGIHGRVTNCTCETHPVKIRSLTTLARSLSIWVSIRWINVLFFLENPMPVSCVDDEVQTFWLYQSRELAHMRRWCRLEKVFNVLA